jgi:predicted dienelactone hydrolase
MTNDLSLNHSKVGNKICSCLVAGLLHLGCYISLETFLNQKAIAADNVILSYGILEFSLSVDSLETYARTGKIDDELQSYANFLTPQQLAELKVGLTTSADFSHLAIAQFLYSFQGETILNRVSKVFKTEARQPGFFAIRSALILAAADQERGLTPLNVIKKFPTDTLRIDSRQGFEIFKDLSKVVQRNALAVAAVEQEVTKERQEMTTVSPKTRNLNLLIPGSYNYQLQMLTMNDRRRDRTFPVELYLPEIKHHPKQPKLPLIVISHGLGSDLTTFSYLAKHLASHGFAVAVPEHPGSSAKQIAALLNGLESDVTPPEELINRPLDIKFLLDRITERFGRQIDVNQVGIIGQSFGGYTALALSGAEINWKLLRHDCPNIDSSWNLSWLIQCLALQIPLVVKEQELKDERITAAIAINPLVSSIFGQESLSKIDIPLILISGSSDPITPSLPEQINPFTWLTTPEKYLVLLKGGTHFSTLAETAGSIPVPKKAIGPSPKIAQDYVRQLGLAFFGKYITQKEAYSNYLNAEYGAVISRKKFPLRLVESLNPDILELESQKQE